MPFDTKSLNVHSPDFSLSRSDVVSVGAAIEYEEGLSILPPVRVDEYVAVRGVVPRADLWAYLALSPSALELGDQPVGVLVQSECLRLRGSIEPSAHPSGLELTPASARRLDVLLWDLLRDVDHLCGVLDKTAVLASGVSLGHSLPHCVG